MALIVGVLRVIRIIIADIGAGDHGGDTGGGDRKNQVKHSLFHNNPIYFKNPAHQGHAGLPREDKYFPL